MQLTIARHRKKKTHMPTYDYSCKSCGHNFEAFQRMTDERLLNCPQCNKPSLTRHIGKGAGLLFKGSGFYLTDYKNQSAVTSASDGSKGIAETKTEKPAGDTTSASTSSAAPTAPSSTPE